MATTPIAVTLLLPLLAPQVPEGWRPLVGDDWTGRVDIHSLLIGTGRAEGRAMAAYEPARAPEGVFRCTIEPSLGTELCGIAFGEDPEAGKACLLTMGGAPGVGGLKLTGPGGEVLFEDAWAPWAAYQAYVLEAVVEHERFRVQMLEANGTTLVSQSDWIEAQAPAETLLAAFTEGGPTRFHDAALADAPLAEVTPDAPNRRRLINEADTPWRVQGTGNWMWTDASRERLRQYAATERAWAVDTSQVGLERVWRTLVRVSPGAGGAGLIIKTGLDSVGGFNCWLGGTWGNGCLMLYHNGGPNAVGSALWAGPEGRWQYDTDMVIEAETTTDRVRVRLLAAETGAVIDESPWIDMPEAEVGKPGFMGFHTWKGPAEFWGFGAEGAAAPTVVAAAGEQNLSQEWRVTGDPGWELSEVGKLAAPLGVSTALLTSLEGSRGTWRCTASPAAQSSSVGLVFQSAADGSAGFVVRLSRSEVTLIDLRRPDATLWRHDLPEWSAGAAYTLEGSVHTDRIVARVIGEAGVLAESPTVYVSQTNNDRIGHIGFASEGGAAVFTGWGYEPGE